MLHHPAIAWVAAFFLGAAGGAAGAAGVAALTKKDGPQAPALPAKVSGSEMEQLSGVTETTCDWRRATNKDLDQYIVGKYREQLKTSVGTHRIVQHKNVVWLLETVSKETDPDFTTHMKDVRGWIRLKAPVQVDTVTTIDSIDDEPLALNQKSQSTIASLPYQSTPSVVATVSLVEEKPSYKRMVIDGNRVVTDNGLLSGSADDLGGKADRSNDLRDEDLAMVHDDLGAIPIRSVKDADKWGIKVVEAPDGKWAIPIKLVSPSGVAAPAPAAAPAGPPSTAPAAAPAGPPSTAPAAKPVAATSASSAAKPAGPPSAAPAAAKKK